MEHKFGWVEVIERNEVRKGRVSDYVLVSRDVPVGKEVVIDQEKNEANSSSSEVSSLSGIENVTAQIATSNNNDSKVSLEFLFYWQCWKCCENNFFLYKRCKACNTDRNQSSPSALLKIAEVASSSSKTVEEAMNNVPISQRDSIPSDVLLQCIEQKSSTDNHRFLDMPFQNVANYFYWNCGFCTMKNSYKTYTCKCCSQKVRA